MEKELIPRNPRFEGVRWISPFQVKESLEALMLLLEPGADRGIPRGNRGNVTHEVGINFLSAKRSLVRSKRFLLGRNSVRLRAFELGIS
jgi:hypothetical protein